MLSSEEYMEVIGVISAAVSPGPKQKFKIINSTIINHMVNYSYQNQRT